MADTSPNTTANPRYLAGENGPYFKPQNELNSEPVDEVLDASWAKVAFLINNDDLENSNDIVNRYWTSANVKFTDTTLGGSIGINPRPQFTQYSDPPVRGRRNKCENVSVKGTKGDYGMGRYYSEAIDDNSQIIFLRFGVPQFSSLSAFLTKSFDGQLTALARTGRGQSKWFQAGEVVGTIGVFAAFPALTTAILGYRLLDTLVSRPRSKFYTLKPTMHTYWSAVNSLVNSIAINSGIFPKIMDSAVKDQAINSAYRVDSSYLDKLNDLMPEMFTKGHGYDIFAMGTKAQRMSNTVTKKEYDEFDSASGSNYIGLVQKDYQENVDEPRGGHTLVSFLHEFLSPLAWFQTGEDTGKTELDLSVDPETGEELKNPKAPDGLMQYLQGEFNQGSEFAAFRVDHAGSVQESFTNSSIESDLANKFNSTSSQAREARFTFADGNIGDGVISNAVESVTQTVGAFAAGTLNAATFGIFNNISGLMGNGYIDIPKHWQSSQASLPRSSYTIQLISPYGNPISRMQNLFIPLAMILAGTLPLSTGKQSYTSPFLVQLYDQGRCQIQLGMIESLSISRGTSNLAFTNKGKVMAIDVTFSVADLSSILHMPLSMGELFGTDVSIDGDNILMDYLAVLAGQDLYSQLYFLPKAKLVISKWINRAMMVSSPAWWASVFHETTTTGMMRYIIPGQALSALSSSANVTVSKN